MFKVIVDEENHGNSLKLEIDGEIVNDLTQLTQSFCKGSDIKARLDEVIKNPKLVEVIGRAIVTLASDQLNKIPEGTAYRFEEIIMDFSLQFPPSIYENLLDLTGAVVIETIPGCDPCPYAIVSYYSNTACLYT